MKQLIELQQKWQNSDLPPVQKTLIAVNNINELITFPALHRLLNPCFSYHYFVDHVKPNGDVVTTKDTTGTCAAWGEQSKEAEHNAYLLAKDIKLLLLHNGAYLKGKKYWITIDGVEHKIIGMTYGNTPLN
jgi:hypothetical protein